MRLAGSPIYKFIVIMEDELYDNFIRTALDRYEKEFGKKTLIYDVVIGDGSRKLQ